MSAVAIVEQVVQTLAVVGVIFLLLVGLLVASALEYRRRGQRPPRRGRRRGDGSGP